MEKALCTVLVNSCDQYSDTWHPFFTLLKKYWPDCPYPLCLNTETKSCDEKSVHVLNSMSSSWGKRLYLALERIESEYVVVLLDDFFLRQKVDSDEIAKCIARMNADREIAVFYYNRITGYTETSIKYKKYYIMTPSNTKNRYMINCQAALWRKNILMEAVKHSETPWDLEERAFAHLPEEMKRMKYYCLKDAWYDEIRVNDVFSYVLVREKGYGVWQSKWLWNNKKLFRQEKIHVNMKSLGRMSRFSFVLEKFKRHIKDRWKIIRRR